MKIGQNFFENNVEIFQMKDTAEKNVLKRSLNVSLICYVA